MEQAAGKAVRGASAGIDDITASMVNGATAGTLLADAIASGEPAHVARYALQLAQVFSSFYHSYPVLQETDPERRTFLLWMTEYFRQQLESTLSILGITVPQYM